MLSLGPTHITAMGEPGRKLKQKGHKMAKKEKKRKKKEIKANEQRKTF